MIDRNELFENLKAWILQLPGVTQAAHRFGGTKFQVEGLEFMHHHGPSFLDIRPLKGRPGNRAEEWDGSPSPVCSSSRMGKLQDREAGRS